MAVAALLALGMLAIIPGMIAGSTLTKSAKQVPNVEVPNVVTQVSAAACAYISDGNWDGFGKCMAGIWGAGAAYGAASQRGNIKVILRTAATFIRTHPWGLAVAVA
jgi:hypothetical protein